MSLIHLSVNLKAEKLLLIKTKARSIAPGFFFVLASLLKLLPGCALILQSKLEKE